jgi:hypothetical protein
VCELGPLQSVCDSPRTAPCGAPPNQTCCEIGRICNGGVCTAPQVGGGIGRLVALGNVVNVNSKPATLGQLLYPSASISTGPDSTALIFLAPDTTLTLQTFGHVRLPPPTPSVSQRVIELLRGLLRLDEPRNTAPQNRFEVQARNSTVGVEGTSVTIEADTDRMRDTVAVFEGAVVVTPTNPALAPIRLEAGQQVEVGVDAVGPVLPCLPRQCDDGEVCTTDACTTIGCENRQMTGLEAACATCQGGLGSRPCAGESVPPGIGKRIALACSLRDRAAANPGAAKRFLRRAKAALKSARAVAKKAAKRTKDALAADCAAAIAAAARPPL